jgi:hypothetical protein
VIVLVFLDEAGVVLQIQCKAIGLHKRWTVKNAGRDGSREKVKK